MSNARFSCIRSEVLAVVALTGLLVLLFCLTLLVPRDLWVQDEARYGEIVREMLATGEWLIPHLNGHPYPDKPPLYFWLVMLAGTVTGHNEMAFRLVTTLSTILATAGVYLTGRRIAGAVAGFWSAAIFATTFLTLVVGQIMRMDMLLTAAAVFAWYALLVNRSGNSAWSLLSFWVCTLLAVAIKGPIALLFTLLPAVVWQVLESGWAGIRGLRLTYGLLTLCCAVAIWMGAAVAQGHAQYLQTIWSEQLVGRTINSWSHKEPFYFYLVLAPLLLMPWTGLVISGARTLYLLREPGWKSVAAFSLIPLLGISLISGKLFIYLQPLVPALCIAAGVAAVYLRPEDRLSRWQSWPPVVFLAVLAAALFWLSHEYLAGHAGYGYGAGGGILLLAAVAVLLTMKRAATWLKGSLAISVCLCWLIFGVVATLLNPLFSAGAMGDAISRLAAADRPVGTVNTTRGILNYYAGRIMEEIEPDSTLAWWKDHPDAVVVIKTRDLDKVFGQTGSVPPCEVDEVFTIELKEYHVLSSCNL